MQCTAIVLLVKPFVWLRSRRRLRLLKLRSTMGQQRVSNIALKGALPRYLATL